MRWAGGLLLFASAAQADIVLSIANGDPYDRLRIWNLAVGSELRGRLHIDFATSEGRVLLDTEYGGLGTKDPMPVEVELGNIRMAPVVEGDRHLTIFLEGVAAGATAVITMDFDNEASFWSGSRVAVIGGHIACTVARFEGGEAGTEATFDPCAVARLSLPARTCPDDEPAEVTCRSPKLGI